MELLLIRHSYAVEPGFQTGGDASRPLTEQGRVVFGRVAAWVAERVVPERIYHSSRLRAVETAEILAAACGLEEALTPAAWLSSGSSLDELVATLQRGVDERVAVVGHEPDMSRTTSALVGGGLFRFEPGSVASVWFEGGVIRAGLGRVRWMLSPRLFTR